MITSIIISFWIICFIGAITLEQKDIDKFSEEESDMVPERTLKIGIITFTLITAPYCFFMDLKHLLKVRRVAKGIEKFKKKNNTDFTPRELDTLGAAGLNASQASEKLRAVMVLAAKSEKYSPLSSRDMFNHYRDINGYQSNFIISDAKVVAMLHVLACRGFGWPGSNLRCIFITLAKPEFKETEDNTDFDFKRFANSQKAELLLLFGSAHAPAVHTLVKDWTKVLEFAKLIQEE